MSEKSFNINNVICSGKFERKEKKSVKIKTHLQFWGNVLKIKENSFTIFVTKNIHFVFVENNFFELLKKRIEGEIECKIGKIHVRITNIHQNISLPFNQGFCVNTFLPRLAKLTKIKNVDITQEKDVAIETSIAKLQEEKNLSFMSLLISCYKKKVTIKIQFNKKKTLSHFTVITTALPVEVRELLHFIESFRNV